MADLYASPPIMAIDELDKLKKVIYLFSCHRKANGEASKELRPQLVVLVALYLKHGVNNKTKDKASKIMGVRRSAINSMNMELRNSDYLVKDTMNIRMNYLHPDLETLGEYIKKETTGRLLFMFTVKNE